MRGVFEYEVDCQEPRMGCGPHGSLGFGAFDGTLAKESRKHWGPPPPNEFLGACGPQSCDDHCGCYNGPTPYQGFGPHHHGPRRDFEQHHDNGPHVNNYGPRHDFRRNTYDCGPHHGGPHRYGHGFGPHPHYYRPQDESFHENRRGLRKHGPPENHQGCELQGHGPFRPHGSGHHGHGREYHGPHHDFPGPMHHRPYHMRSCRPCNLLRPYRLRIRRECCRSRSGSPRGENDCGGSGRDRSPCKRDRSGGRKKSSDCRRYRRGESRERRESSPSRENQETVLVQRIVVEKTPRCRSV